MLSAAQRKTIKIYEENSRLRKDQIKAACTKQGITMSELARRIGMSKQNFHGKLQKETFRDYELDKMAEILGCKYVCCFEFKSDTKDIIKNGSL